MASKSEQGMGELSVEKAAAGLLALLVDAREQRIASDKTATSTEVLLSNAGLSVDEISSLTGKTYNATWKTINRAKSKS